MAPAAPALAQSDSKARFMKRLGLDEANKMHRYLYSLMKTEAVDGWTRMTANREALLAELKHNSSIEPPYTFSQLDETAVHKEVINIYHNARPETKIMYGLGHDGDENWIIRWLLWHVFRYRDERNSGSNRRRGQSTSVDGSLDDDNRSDDLPASTAETPGMVAASVTSQQTGSAESGEVSGDTTRSDSAVTSRYWDPIREEFRS